MCSVRDEQPSIHLDASLLETSDLMEKGGEVHHYTIANDADGLWVEDA
jgi:hypothetical protein